MDEAAALVQWFDDNSFLQDTGPPNSKAASSEVQRFVVAFSGGVDSAVVLAAAHRSRAHVIAATSGSPSVAKIEQDDASRVAHRLGVDHHWVTTRELDNSAYRANDGRRCYHCKSTLFAALQLAFPGYTIVTGTNADDLEDYRPGLQAASENQVRAPLAELSLTKASVRSIARHWELEIAEKPASPCLASRLDFGVEVTAQRLEMVERAERFLRDLGMNELRVRVHASEHARIEVPSEALGKLVEETTRKRLVAVFKELGFRFVTLDLEGFRSGSLSEVYKLTDMRLD